MRRQTWTTRLVLLMGCVFFGASVVAATAHSSVALWPVFAAAPPTTHATSAPVPAAARGPAALFSDDFADDPVGSNPPKGWMVADGRWDGVVSDGGHMVRHARGASYGHLVTGSPAWTNYTVSADVRATSLPSGFAAVVARYQGPSDYYACGIYGVNTLRLWVMRGGNMTELGRRAIAADTARFHGVRLTVTGAAMSCSLDGAPPLTAIDRTFRNGRIALLASSEEAAEFGDVWVTL
jgi:hypothetical protein